MTTLPTTPVIVRVRRVAEPGVTVVELDGTTSDTAPPAASRLTYTVEDGDGYVIHESASRELAIEAARSLLRRRALRGDNGGQP